MLVLLWFLNDTRQSIYYNSLNLWFEGIGVTIVTFMLSIPFSLMWEVPFMNIEKYILFPPKKRENKAIPNKLDQERLSDKGEKYEAINEEKDTEISIKQPLK